MRSARFAEGLRALVVDDEHAICELLSILLQGVGFSVQTAGDLKEARAAAPAGFDLAVIDKNLPDGTGLDAIVDIRKYQPDAAVLVITAFPSIQSARAAVSLGLTDYVLKPFELDWIENRIERLIGELVSYRERAQLIEELEEKNRMLEELVVRDGLTRLHNHRFLQESLTREIARARRGSGTISLLLIDVDDFKSVNDAHGHPKGDAVLQQIAEILMGETRSTDDAFRLRERDIAGRYGGDEFALILPETPSGGAAIKAERLRKFVADFDFKALRLPSVTLSIGVANFPRDGQDRSSLVEAADVALYAAKRVGKNRILSYGPSLVRAGVERMKAARETVDLYLALDESIATESFDFAYQPIVKSDGFEIAAYEALCRPVDRDHFPHPGVLFETAGRAGRVQDLGDVVRRLAPRPMRHLPPGVALSVNLHPLELNDELITWAEGVAHDDARRLILEITETSAIQNYRYTAELVARLRELGFRIALDDLGAGYMGLNALVRLSPNYLKLDMSLLRGIEAESSSAHLIQHLLTYARGEGIGVIAEGIETTAERDVVIGLGCEMMQGYLFAKPAPPFCEIDPQSVT